MQALGIAYLNKLDLDREIEAYKKTIKIYEDNKMRNHPDYAICHTNLGIAYYNSAKKKEVIKYHELALIIFEHSVGKEHPYYKECLKNLNFIRRAGRDNLN